MANDNHDWRMGWKGLVGIASCGIGLVVVYFGYGIGTESPKKNAAAEVTPAADQKDKRPVRAMNLALGNMVYFAHDLGFSVKNDAGTAVDPSKIAARIENQLHGMRSLYRQEIAKNTALAGNLVLQFHVSQSGEVSQVRELSARLNDAEFKKAAIAQAASWSFAELVSENLEVTCPLLFVHEGMDITTLVQWEKSVEASVVKTTVARPTAAPVHAPAVLAPVAPPAQRAVMKTDAKEFQIKYATSLRKDPNFSAPSLLTFTIGTKVTVLRRQGDWLEVRSRAEGPTGFIRKEFVTPIQLAHQ
jgi:hypothetical protein